MITFTTTSNVIYSDEWRVYNGISQEVPGNYTQMTVDHLVNFVDPVTGKRYNSDDHLLLHNILLLYI